MKRTSRFPRISQTPLVLAVLFSTSAFAVGIGVQTNLGVGVGAGVVGAPLPVGAAMNSTLNASARSGINSTMPGAIDGRLGASTGSAGAAGSRVGTPLGGSLNTTGTASTTLDGAAREPGSVVRVEKSLIDAQARTHSLSMQNLAAARARLVARNRTRGVAGLDTAIDASQQGQARIRASEQARAASAVGSNTAAGAVTHSAAALHASEQGKLKSDAFTLSGRTSTSGSAQGKLRTDR